MKKINRIVFRNLIFLVCLLVLTGCNTNISREPIEFRIDVSGPVGMNTGFWKAAGHDHLFKIVNEPLGQELLDRAEKFRSVTYYRTHYTFSNRSAKDKEAGGSVCGRVVTRDENGYLKYDFSIVNKTFREYVKRGMKPIVEFDFFPDGMAAKDTGIRKDESARSNETGPADWNAWEELLKRFMQNLVDTFGMEELRTWYFEVWNEPDGWPADQLDIFFRMYDTFAWVVKSFDPRFRVGGPACFNLFFMEYFLQHIVKGKNLKTGETGSPLDFVSHHVYGLSGGWLHSPPTIVPQVSRFTVELLWVDRMLSRHGLKGRVEFLLNEWGVCSNYERTVDQYPQLVYRNNEFSALFMVKLVDCLFALEDNFKFKTSLLAYWGFCGEASLGRMFAGNRDLTTGNNIPKPILFAYEMLALLGSERLKTEDFYIGSRFARGERYGIIPTRDSTRIVFIIYNFNETDDDLNRIDPVRVSLDNLTAGKSYTFREILLDDRHNNNHTRWILAGKPSDPSDLSSDFMATAKKMEINRTGSVRADRKGTISMKIPLKRHSMKLFELTE